MSEGLILAGAWFGVLLLVIAAMRIAQRADKESESALREAGLCDFEGCGCLAAYVLNVNGKKIPTCETHGRVLVERERDAEFQTFGVAA
jgi:hypothetical protein